MLIFNPSCLPHGGRRARWPRSPGTRRDHAGTGHPFLEMAGAGGRHEPRRPRGHWRFPSLVGAQRGVLGCSRRGTRVRGRREAPAFVAGGVRDVPMAPVQTAAAAARECPGRGDPGLKANRRRAGGWEKGRKPVSLCPLPPRHGGARGERGVPSPGHWRASPQPGGRKHSQTPTQTGPSGG